MEHIILFRVPVNLTLIYIKKKIIIISIIKITPTDIIVQKLISKERIN